MSVFAELHDGRRLEFPDGTDPAVIRSTVKKMIGGSGAPAQAPKQDAPPDVRALMPAMVGGRLAPDLLMGARQTWDAAAQLGARGAEAIANKFGGSKTLTGMREDTVSVNKEAFDAYRTRFNPDAETGASFARGVGQGIVTAPITPAIKAGGVIKSMLGGAGIGAGAGALSPVYEGNFWDEKKKQAGLGAAFGGALGTAAGALGKFGPTAKAKALASAGVRVPTGRAAGGVIGRLEEGAESIPVAGDVIKGAHRRAVEDFNRATFDKEVLAPIGEKLSPSAIGHAAVKEARIKISKHYNTALDKIGRVDLDKQFSDEGTKLAQMSSALGDATQKQFINILKTRVFDKITPAGTMSATTMKAVDSDLGRLAWKYRKSSDANQQELGSALRELQASLRSATERSAGPELAGEVSKANAAWANWERVADAASRAGSKEGVFSPAALRGAVSKADKRSFREGDARMQDWAQSAESVLGPKVPDSGTPFRLLGSAGLGGFLLDPTIATTGAGLAAAYSKPGQRALAAMLRDADKAKAIAPYLGLLAPGLLQGQ